MTDSGARADAASEHPARRGDRYWIVLGVRALVALVIGLVVTFSSDHSILVGHAAFGSLALGLGLVQLVGGLVAQVGVERGITAVSGLVGIAIGLIALLTPNSGVPFLFLLVSGWAVITGFLELYLGIRGRRRVAQARDWIFAGALTVLLAVIVLLIPAGYSQSFTGPDHVERTLTAAVVGVGIIGAYGAVLGVFLAIASLSLRWAARASTTEALD